MSTSAQSSQLKVCWFVTISKDGMNPSAQTPNVQKLADLTSAYYKGKSDEGVTVEKGQLMYWEGWNFYTTKVKSAAAGRDINAEVWEREVERSKKSEQKTLEYGLWKLKDELLRESKEKLKTEGGGIVYRLVESKTELGITMKNMQSGHGIVRQAVPKPRKLVVDKIWSLEAYRKLSNDEKARRDM